MEGQAESKQQEQPAQEGVLKINIEFDVKTGIVKVSGHIGNTDLCMKVIVEAAHSILMNNAEEDNKRMAQASSAMEIVMNAAKKNGVGKTPPVVN